MNPDRSHEDTDAGSTMQAEFNERYMSLCREQQEVRRRAAMDLGAGEVPMNARQVSSILATRNEAFDGHLLVAAANDFGYPVGFAPSALDGVAAAFERFHDTVIIKKWAPEDTRLRRVWRDLRVDADGVHMALPAVATPTESRVEIEYDITPPATQDYTFVTLRDAIGLLDWICNGANPAEATVRY